MLFSGNLSEESFNVLLYRRLDQRTREKNDTTTKPFTVDTLKVDGESVIGGLSWTRSITTRTNAECSYYDKGRKYLKSTLPSLSLPKSNKNTNIDWYYIDCWIQNAYYKNHSHEIKRNSVTLVCYYMCNWYWGKLRYITYLKVQNVKLTFSF